MKRRIVTGGAIAIGWLFIVLGILGIFLPILQGIFFLLIGLYLLMRFSPRFAAFIRRQRGRHHRFDAILDTLEAKLGTDPISAKEQ